MQKMIRFVLTLFIGLTLAIWVTLGIGYLQPEPSPIAVLRLNACQLPCWIGIQPGTTTFEEAQTIIKRHASDFPGYDFDFDPLVSPDSLAISLRDHISQIEYVKVILGSYVSSKVIDDIDFQFNLDAANLPTLGDLNRLLGMPTHLRLDYPTDYLVGYGDADSGVIAVPQYIYAAQSPRPDTPIQEIELYVHPNDSGGWCAWDGYGSMHLYGDSCQETSSFR